MPAIGGQNSTSGMPPNPAPPVQAFFQALDWLGCLGRLAVVPSEMPSSTLHVWVLAGVIQTLADVRVSVAAEPLLAVVASATNYVYATADGILGVNQTGWPSDSDTAPLAVVVTDAHKVLTIVDVRGVLRVGR